MSKFHYLLIQFCGMTNYRLSFKRKPQRHRGWVILTLALFSFCHLIDCRNIRGRSRHNRPRADPHVVATLAAPVSIEVKAKNANHQRGRRCQVTTIEEKSSLFELPYYNEGRAVLPFFFKISGSIDWKRGMLL